MRPKVVGIGELLWDLLPGGAQLGAAPANFTYHACALGADARLVSRVGTDDLGRQAKDRLTSLGVPVDAIQSDSLRPTGTVTVSLGVDGQPHFEIQQNVAWDVLQVDSLGVAAVAAANAVCFGTLGQRSDPSRATVRSLLGAAPSSALRIFDINLRQQYFSAPLVEKSLRLANVLKINDGELPWLANTFDLRGNERAQIRQIADQFRLRLVAYTRGRRGSLLFSNGQWSEHPGVKTTVVDTVGAGDAFSAAMTLGLLFEWPLEEVNRLANEVAAYVCSQPGATPTLPEPLRAPFLESANRRS